MTRLGESLQIAKVEKEDEGVYTCLALSQIGNSHAKAKLTVIGKDFFVPCFMPCFSTTLRYPLLYQRDKILFSNPFSNKVRAGKDALEILNTSHLAILHC